MAITRDIKQNAAGGWDVLKQGDRRAGVSAPTKKAALAQARRLVLSEGGGEIRIVDGTGKIVDLSEIKVSAKRAKRAATVG